MNCSSMEAREGGLWQVLNRPLIATVAGSVIPVLVVVVFNAS